MPAVERARPWLGTIVSIRAESADADVARSAIGHAFADIADVHARMSFQSSDSDLAAVGRLPAGGSCVVDPRTAQCLAAALALAEASQGVFDPVLPGSGTSWRDLAVDDRSVAVARPLRVDLSGIAKGFAVDRACAVLHAQGVTAGLVNAGGDLRSFGTTGESIALRPAGKAPAAIVRIEDAALASSDVAGAIAEYGGAQHRDGRTGQALAAGFASVVAPCCRDADGLTKIVLALGDAAAPLLASYGAVAYAHRPDRGWWTIGDEA